MRPPVVFLGAAVAAAVVVWAAPVRAGEPSKAPAKEPPAKPREAAKEAPREAAKESPSDLIEMEVRDVITVHEGAGHAVILSPKGSDTIVPIFIGDAEAMAIALRLRRTSPPRPLTHDLLEKVIRSLGARVTKIHIDDLRDSVYLGRVFLAQGEKAVELDARPSDSIALAIGSAVPIFAARKVVDEAGVTRKELEKPRNGPRRLGGKDARDESL